MASQKGTVVPSPELIDPADERWALVQRIVSSSSFARAPHLRGFLLFVSERLLTRRASEINEYEIGRLVLGRRGNFNPHEDNIVRVQARHLRAKLEQYFETEGKDEPLVVTIPRGSYVPSFEARAAAEPVVEARVEAPPAPFSPVMRVAAGCVLLATIALLAAWILRTPARAVTSPASAGGNQLLARVLRTGDSTKVVISDASLVLLQESLQRLVSLDDYLRADYPQLLWPGTRDSGTRRRLIRYATRPFTSYSDLESTHRILALSHQYQTNAIIRHPRDLHLRDFQTGSFVLLGGPLADPWYRLFDKHLNFTLESDLAKGTTWIRNKAPLNREPAIYSPRSGDGAIEYAFVSLVPNLRGTGNVLLVAGTAPESAEAASDMVIRDELPATLRGLADQCRGPQDGLEVLLETQVLAGVPHESKILAWRLHKGGD
jgi:hypothetical protein